MEILIWALWDLRFALQHFRRHKHSDKIADFRSAISPTSELRFDPFFFLNWVIFREESRSGIFFCKFCTKCFRSDLKSRRPKKFPAKKLRLKYAWNPHSHGIVTCSDTTDPDLGRRPPRSERLKWIVGGETPQDLKTWIGSWGKGPQDLITWIARRKIGEFPINKTTKKESSGNNASFH